MARASSSACAIGAKVAKASIPTAQRRPIFMFSFGGAWPATSCKFCRVCGSMTYFAFLLVVFVSQWRGSAGSFEGAEATYWSQREQVGPNTIPVAHLRCVCSRLPRSHWAQLGVKTVRQSCCATGASLSADRVKSVSPFQESGLVAPRRTRSRPYCSRHPRPGSLRPPK